MKVLLGHRASPSREEAGDEEALALPACLTGIALVLTQAGHEASVANFSRLGWRDVHRFLEARRPDLFAACLAGTDRGALARLLRLVRRVRADAVIVAGGPDVAALGSSPFRRIPQLDALVLGAGERPLLEACERLAGGRANLEGIRGLLTRGASTGSVLAAPPEPDLVPVDAGLLEAAGVEPERDLRWIVASQRDEAGGGVALRSPRRVARLARSLRETHGLVELSMLGPALAGAGTLEGLGRALMAAKVGAAWEMSAERAELAGGGRSGRAASATDEALTCAARSGLRRVRVTLDAAELHESSAPRIAAELAAASEALRAVGVEPDLCVLYGTAAQDAAEVAALRQLIRAFRPRTGRLEVRRRPVEDAIPAEPRDALEAVEGTPPEASARQLELARPALELTLRDACREGRPGPRALEAVERRLGGGCWASIGWGDFRAAHGDPEEAERRYREAARAEPSNPHPWLRLAALGARASRVELERAGLRGVLDRVPRHRASRERLEQLRVAKPDRRRRRSRPR